MKETKSIYTRETRVFARIVRMGRISTGIVTSIVT